MTMVTNAPTPTARKRFDVSFSRIDRILLPAATFIPSLIISIPYRNMPRPPNKLVIIKNTEISLPLEAAGDNAKVAVGRKLKIAKIKKKALLLLFI